MSEPDMSGPDMSAPTLEIHRNIEVPMRDGVVLRADLYRPAGEGRHPVVLQRTPYDKSLKSNAFMMMDPLRTAEAGFAVVVQDTRGRFKSEGTFTVFRDDIADGYDTVEWCAAQPWSTGAVGMYGASYVGATQWLAAISAPPSLRAIFPQITASQYHEGWTHQGGAFALGFNLSWAVAGLAPDTFRRLRKERPELTPAFHRLVGAIDDLGEWFRYLPLSEHPLLGEAAPYFYDWIAHPNDDDWWAPIRVDEQYGQITVPALNVGGWYDIFLTGTLANYVGMGARGGTETARSGQRLVVGPWHHMVSPSNVAGEVDFGAAANALAVDLDAMGIHWFKQWLGDAEPSGPGLDGQDPPVRLFVMGENRWRTFQDWPVPGATATPWYLHSEGRAQSLRGDGTLSPVPPGGEEAHDVFISDPRDPVKTRGGGLCCWPGAIPGGAYDQRLVEDRSDVLVYSSEVLTEDITVIGPVVCVLHAATSAPDCDFTAKLVDVHPDGYARNLCDGILRGRYRQGRDTPRLLDPGQVYEWRIDLVATANVFQAGHRIRLEIASANFPRFDRNPQTGEASGTATQLAAALQQVFHDTARPSHVLLPVLGSR